MTVEILEGSSTERWADLPQIDCLIADPPYGVDYQSRRATTPQGLRWVQDLEGDQDLDGALQLFADVVPNIVEHKMCDEAEVYVFTRWDIVDTWIRAVRDLLGPLGCHYKMLLIWAKGYPGQGDIDANWGCGHELILYCKRGRRLMKERRSGILHVDKLPNMKHVHPTEKPVALMEMLIEASTDPGDTVADPFSGSGASIVAAQNLGRNGYGIELQPRYVEVSRQRLSQKTLF